MGVWGQDTLTRDVVRAVHEARDTGEIKGDSKVGLSALPDFQLLYKLAGHLQAWRSGLDTLCKSCEKREIKTGSWAFKGSSGEVGGHLGWKGSECRAGIRLWWGAFRPDRFLHSQGQGVVGKGTFLNWVLCSFVFAFQTCLPMDTSKAVAYYENFLKFVLNREVSLIQSWLVWFSGLSAGLQTERSPVRFPVRAHAWVAGQVPGGDLQEVTN